MSSAKASLIIALAIGAFISSALLVAEPLDFALLSLEWTGITAAYSSGERSEGSPSSASPFAGP